MKLTFIETRVFSARWNRRSDDEGLRKLQNELLENPERGDSIPGCGILRKVRCADEKRAKGKRGGLRVIYLHTPEVDRIDLITVYDKGEADDLSTSELKELCELARVLRFEAVRRTQRRSQKGRDR